MAADLKPFFNTVKLKDAMRSPVVTIHEDEDLSVAQIRFLNHHISHLLVVDRKNSLVGIISQKYLYKTHSPRRILNEEMRYSSNVIVDGDSFYEKQALDGYILRSVMNKNPFTMGPEESLGLAILAMEEKNLGCIPITDKENQILGVLTTQEVVHYIAKLIHG
jgi:CBS domain-containing protein